LCFICPCISLFKLYFYTNLIGCMCFYEANIIVRVVREYPKFRVPEISGITKPVVISDIDSQNPKFEKPEIPDRKFSGNPNAHPCMSPFLWCLFSYLLFFSSVHASTGKKANNYTSRSRTGRCGAKRRAIPRPFVSLHRRAHMSSPPSSITVPTQLGMVSFEAATTSPPSAPPRHDAPPVGGHPVQNSPFLSPTHSPLPYL
jgi:hypothetical protein